MPAASGTETVVPIRSKILMVDDEPNNLLALEAVLEGLDQVLVRANSGKEALRRVLEDDFAVILMDVQMPEMDGFETATLIRSREKSRYTPILFLTAAGKTEADIFRGYAIGAVDYLLKPFAPEILRYKVKVLIDLYQKSDEIKRLNAELQVLNSGLEERVQERTAALVRRSQDLARSNQELAQFSTVASHDLQEPLRTLSTYLQLFRENSQGQYSADDKELMEVVLSSAKRMREMINDLLAFSQVGQGDRKLETVDCSALVSKVIAALKVRVDECRASVSVGTLPTLAAEASLLGLVFQNLIDNALKFCTNKAPTVEVSCHEDTAEWVFAVKDNGIGIGPEHFERIFKLFQRLHPRESYPGSGLGLSICKKIVERHGGRIWLKSTPGLGSTFFFSLPKE